MSLTKTYTRDRLILHGVASDYARDNPGTTASQLTQLFGLNQGEAVGVIHSVKAGTSLGPEQTQEVIDWAIANNAGAVKIIYQWGITERAAQQIAKIARAREPKKINRVVATDEAIQNAKQFCVDNLEVPCEQIARQFGVSSAILRRHRRINAVKIQVGGSQPATPRPAAKPRRTLYAITTDGEQIDPRCVRDVSKIERFVEVLV